MMFGGFVEYLAITIAALFVIVNPLTTAFIFVSLLPHAKKKTIRATAKRSSLVAGVRNYLGGDCCAIRY
ncbi:hypothetical protein [Aliidiomarina sanyensis]|uniref:Uncharacterized protein n=1 Tax=Aliidiomarina sanyensis TaxID=1249555 RepID=A0A432WKD4_9GAMM|nr:hypothetical protein [Aliidiomarina sanyensis]RUO34266.1 hypothetical protein CWE11_05935 [Aliidiomarina sanyensis]